MRDPHTVAAVIGALRRVHGDDTARTMLTKGTTLAVLIDALLRSPIANRDASKMMMRVLHASDFTVTPDFSAGWHIKYVYESPRSLDVVDLNVMTLDYGTLASTDIRLLLQVSH